MVAEGGPSYGPEIPPPHPAFPLTRKLVGHSPNYASSHMRSRSDVFSPRISHSRTAITPEPFLTIFIRHGKVLFYCSTTIVVLQIRSMVHYAVFQDIP